MSTFILDVSIVLQSAETVFVFGFYVLFICTFRFWFQILSVLAECGYYFLVKLVELLDECGLKSSWYGIGTKLLLYSDNFQNYLCNQVIH